MFKIIISLTLLLSPFTLYAKLPTVIIVHGISSFKEFHHELISPLTKRLKEADFSVVLAHTPMVATVDEQVRILENEIIKFNIQDEELILLGHSFGGLVVRKYAHDFNETRNILNVTTLGTPNRGSHEGIDEENKTLRNISKILVFFGSNFLDEFVVASNEMSYLNTSLFNQEVLDSPNIDYLSVIVTQDKKRTTPFMGNSQIVTVNNPIDEEIKDGIVPLRSAMWSKVLYANKCIYPVPENLKILGPLYKANHLNMIVSLTNSLPFYESPSGLLANDIVDYLLTISKSKVNRYKNPDHCHEH